MMKRIIAKIGATALLFLASFQCVAAAGLAVTDITPQINYGTCVSTNPLRALTDGRVVEQRSWLGNDCMAWTLRQNVTALLSLPGASGDRTIKISGTRFSKGDVTPPGFVDVFVGQDSKRLKFFSRVQVDLPDVDGRYDILVNVPSSASVVALNMFVPNRHLSLSEIALAPTTQTNIAQSSRTAGQEIPECIWNECAKVSALISSTGMSTTSGSGAVNGSFGWITNRFSNIVGNVKTDQALEISRDAGETVRYPFYIPTASSFNISINGSATPAANVSLWKAEWISAANSVSVPDKLTPLSASTARCTDAAGCIIWLAVPSTSLKAGANLIEVSTPSSGKIKLSVQLSNASPSTSRYYVNGWSYKHDPVWAGTNMGDYLAALRNFNIDVLVVPPWQIPQPRMATAASNSTGSALVNTLKSVPADRKILLYLGWGGSSGPKAKWYNDIVNSKQEQAVFNAWLDQLISILNSAGIPPDRWYLYPIDEPTSSELSELMTFQALCKQKNPRVRLYTTLDNVNPGQDAANARAIISGFDFVQIKSTLMARTDMNLGNKANILVYTVPPSPAKSLAPEYYWNAASRPAAAGFSGAGVWSISDSDGSDPNNDFDGKFPDFTMLYLNNSQVVPSARMLGFLEGTQDARWLKSHPTVVAPADVSYQKMETLRKDHQRDDASSPPAAPQLIRIQ